MSIALNRKTKEILESVSTPDYQDNPDWIIIKCSPLGIDKKLPTCDKKYWKIVGDDIIEMTAAEKQVVDDAEALAQKQALEKAELSKKIAKKYREIAIKELIAEKEIPADYVDK